MRNKQLWPKFPLRQQFGLEVPEFTFTDINAAIGSTAAAASSQTVVLPYGRYTGSIISIPDGTHDLILDISAAQIVSDGTGNSILGALDIGFSNVFTSSPTILLEDVDEGDLTVTLKAGQTAPTVGYYYLLNTNEAVKHISSSSQVAYKRELVKVTAVDGLVVTLEFGASPTGIDATLEHTGAARDYHYTDASKNPRLSSYDQTKVCKNITIRGSGTGSIDAGGRPQGIIAGLVDGLVIDGVKVFNYKQGGFHPVVCKDVEITNCISESPTQSGAGDGYDFYIQSCRGVLVRGCYSKRGASGLARHSVICHGGSSDVFAVDCFSEGANPDTHGMDERRVHFLRCNKSPGFTNGINIGNPAWLGGAKNIIVEDCDLDANFNLHPNVDGLTVKNSKFANLRIQSASNTAAIPSGGYPTNWSFDSDCVFTTSGNLNVIDAYSPLETGGLLRCGIGEFNAQVVVNQQYFRSILAVDSASSNTVIKKIQGTLTIDGMVATRTKIATSFASTMVVPFTFKPNDNFNLILKNCDITSPTSRAVNIRSPWTVGSCVVTDNNLTTASSSPAFVSDDTAVTVSKTLSGNTAGP